MVVRASLALAVLGLTTAGAASGQDLAASVPLEIRGQIDDGHSLGNGAAALAPGDL